MVRKIFRTGNSMVVSLPKDAIDLLGLGAGSRVFVEVDRKRRRIIITPVHPRLPGLARKRSLARKRKRIMAPPRKTIATPVHPEFPGVDEEFARQVAEFIEQYRPALEALARR